MTGIAGKKMPRLGKTQIETPSIIMGAWALGGWYWGGADDAEGIKTIHASLDAGINAFDTAPMYGCGHSEKVLGQALKGRRHEAVILTKVGLRWDCTEGAFFFSVSEADGGHAIYRNLRPDSIITEVERSLRRLQTDYIDVLQCHWPDPSYPIADTMSAFIHLHRAGQIRAVGVSNFDPQLLQDAQAALGDVPLASTQPRYSLMNRGIEADVIPWLLANSVGAIVYSPIERGLLSGKVTTDRIFPESDGRSSDPMFTPENRQAVLEALSDIADIAERHQCSFAQLTAAWCIHQPGITAAIMGARTPQQAIENAYTTQIQLSLDEQTRLRNRFTSLQAAKIP